MSEHDFQNAVIDYLTQRGYLVLRINGGAAAGEYKGKRRFVRFVFWKILGKAMQSAGVADILALSPAGQFWAIECKRPGGKATDFQQAFLAEVRKRGGIGIVASSLDHITEAENVCAQTWQEVVANATAQRGYRRDWTARQFMRRQSIKLIEEVAELADETIPDVFFVNRAIGQAGELAGVAFDKAAPDVFDGDGVDIDTAALTSEMADVMVVMANMAQSLEELTGQAVDLTGMAIDKARADISRGKRQV